MKRKLSEKDLESQIKKTQDAHEKFTTENEMLKKVFEEIYDPITVCSLLELLKKGHPSEKQFATRFETSYNNGNYDDVEVTEFKRLLGKYGESLVESLRKGDLK